MTHITQIKIGTRKSPLAMRQAELVKNELLRAHPYFSEDTFEIIPIHTSGDIHKDIRLADIGGKGLFTKEIDAALMDGRIDFAVHSLKDIETLIPKGVTLAGVLEREDPRDVLISRDNLKLMDLPKGAVVGTASARRHAHILGLRPDLEVRLMRGNVNTRLEKISAGSYDATILAYAGLLRLGKAQVSEIFDPDTMVPAVGQGVIGICAREQDKDFISLIRNITHDETEKCIIAERTMLAKLDGSCRTPIGGYARIIHGKIVLTGFLSNDTMDKAVKTKDMGTNAIELGTRIAQDLKSEFS
jgi:hydroxymethylbilane synthase